MVSRELEKECVVVFDEAHNIDNVCIEVCCLPPLRTPSHGLSFGLLASLCLSPDSVVHDAGSTHALAAAWSLSGSTPFAARMLQAAGLQWHALQALSVTLRKQTLDGAMRNVGKLKAAVDKCKETDAQRLTNEYQRLVGGLQVTLAHSGTVRGTWSCSQESNPKLHTNGLCDQDVLSTAPQPGG